MAVDTACLSDWVGRTRVAKDVVSPSDTHRLAACLDRAMPPQQGSELPACWHWVLFQPTDRQSEIGSDGHPKAGDFLPPVPLPRRMFVGITIDTAKPLRVGDTVTRVSKIASIAPKEGKQGLLVFVTMQHELTSSSGGSLVEEHRMVFRDNPKPGAKLQQDAGQPPSAAWQTPFHFDPVVVFRFCAATFNAHRIHYDEHYARDIEGYPNLVVPGRLAALMLLEALRAQDDRAVAHFSFRAERPIWVGDRALGCGRLNADGEAALWVTGPSGHVAMTASARFEPR